MIAFIKRRWVLMSCAVGFVICSVIHVYARIDIGRTGDYRSHGFGITRGDVFYATIRHMVDYPLERDCNFGVSRPSLGGLPSWNPDSREFRVMVPLWFPLSAVLGWLVFRELRWRERRAKLEHSI
jgi:hypothetical protein